MSTIFGVFDKHGHDIPADWVKLMSTPCDLWPRDRESSINKGACFLSCLQWFNTPQSPLAEQPYTQLDSSITLVFDGRLDNRSELAKLIGLPLTDKTTDEWLLLSAFQKYNTELGQYLLGDFSLVFYDTKKHELFIIRDQLGVRPLFIASNNNYFAFASNKAALLSLPWVSEQTDEQWLADLLTITKVDYHSTLYQSIESFPPAHWLQLHNRRQTLKQYWQLDLNYQHSMLSETEYIAEFKSLLFESVQCRLRTYGEPACELSGGLDSTSITSVAAILLEQESIHAYSHVMREEDKGKIFPYQDEKEYMDVLTKRHINITHHTVTSEGLGIIDALDYSVKVHSGPIRNDLSQLGDELFLQLKENSRRCLLSGFGGDQLVTSSGSGWDEELIDNGQWGQLVKLTASLTDNWQQCFKTLVCSIARFKLGVKGVRQREFEKSWSARLKQVGLNGKFAEKYGYPKRYYNNPTRKNNGNIKQREYDVIYSPHVLYRLEDSAVGAASYGVDYRYPLLDIKLLQFCIALPFQLKITKGVRRNMIRKAMDGILPNMIRLRHDKSGATIPTTFQRILNERKNLHKFILSTKDDAMVQSYISGNKLLDYLTLISARLDKSVLLKQKSLLRRISLLLWLKRH